MANVEGINISPVTPAVVMEEEKHISFKPFSGFLKHFK